VSNPDADADGVQGPAGRQPAQHGLNLTVGGTHATTGAPAILTGTTYPSRGIEIRWQHVDHVPLLDVPRQSKSRSAPRRQVALDLTPPRKSRSWVTSKRRPCNSVGLVHGTVPGNKVAHLAADVQLINPTKQAVSGKRLIELRPELRSHSGNDEARIVTSF
jgi:hypothetical protein